MEPASLTSPHWQVGSLPLAPPGEPHDTLSTSFSLLSAAWGTQLFTKWFALWPPACRWGTSNFRDKEPEGISITAFFENKPGAAVNTGLKMCVPRCLVMSDSVTPCTVATRSLCPCESPGKNTEVGCHFLLQGVFLTQGSSPCLLGLLHWPVDSLVQLPPEKPKSVYGNGQTPVKMMP